MVLVIKKTYSKFFCASALSVFVLFGSGGFAYAQQVDFMGDNAVISNGCPDIAEIPSICGSAVFTPFPDVNVPNLNFPAADTDGVIIGTNLSNSHTGSAASGNVAITNGGLVTSSYLYAGFEANTEGSLTIDGLGSEWDARTGIFGLYGTGRLSVTGGARYEQMVAGHLFLGFYEGSKGYGLVSGVDEATSTASTVISHDGMYVGREGHGELRILDGGYLETWHSSAVAGKASGSGLVIISGVNEATGLRSTFKVANRQLWVGSSGPADHGAYGELRVLDGGLLDVDDEVSADGKDGHVIISGVNAATGTRSQADAYSLHAGDYENGTIRILDGAIANVFYAAMALRPGGNGVFIVDGVNAATGDRSTLLADSNIYVSQISESEFTASGGALVHSKAHLVIADYANSVGTLNIQDEGTEVFADIFTRVGRDGNGYLNLLDHGRLITPEVLLAVEDGSTGVLNIGDGQKAGILDTAKITGGLGNGHLNFNHNEDISFAPLITGNVSVSHYGMASGTTTLSSASDYTGDTYVLEGILRAGGVNYFSANSDFLLTNSGTLDLGGHNQTLDNLSNGAKLQFGNNVDTQLTITDTYTGNDGVIVFNIKFDGNTNPANRLIADKTEGHSFIRLNNLQDTGEKAAHDIKLVDVLSVSDGSFTLLSDYVYIDDYVAVSGPYAYKLYQGSTQTPNDGDWYLRSALMSNGNDILFQAGVPTYEIYPQALLALNAVDTLQQRAGNRSWVMPDSGGMSGDPGAEQQQHTMPDIDRGGVWMRIDGAHHHIEPNASRSVEDFSQNIIKAQLGIEKMLNESDSGKIIGGIHGQYSHGNTDISSVHGDGKISTDGYGLGLSATWYGNDNLYIDTQAQATWYRSDLHSKLARRELVGGNNGLGYGASAEVGKRIAIAPAWSVTPQTQLSYSSVKFDSFDDTFDAHVSSQKGHIAQGRAGLSVEQEKEWAGQNGTPQRQHLYGIANVYYDFVHSTHVDVASTKFSSENDRLWGGVGVGGSRNWADGKYSIYGEVAANTSLENPGDSYSAKGNVGFRIRW
ncbi:MAG: autotransporter outer membrane beta-barrel domain-containing protein [Micavibrio sp.]